MIVAGVPLAARCPRQSTLSSVFRTHLDALHFKKMESSRLTGEDAPASSEEHKRVYGEGDVTEAALAARCVVCVCVARWHVDAGLQQRCALGRAWETASFTPGVVCAARPAPAAGSAWWPCLARPTCTRT